MKEKKLHVLTQHFPAKYFCTSIVFPQENRVSASVRVPHSVKVEVMFQELLF